ncbi:hypothetical protein FIBSPDRAFT_864229 [Athelia psychrophila]|uniref:Uncharacterized protein n=1 Tax=Athelia psychrophila TaxID=1759441 RepID=A0A166GRG7_9AGAM|nr:hypothetical protein FIBSPDRAFT_864229 [Fibularhizoctonia sp. CBS 109695]
MTSCRLSYRSKGLRTPDCRGVVSAEVDGARCPRSTLLVFVKESWWLKAVQIAYSRDL